MAVETELTTTVDVQSDVIKRKAMNDKFDICDANSLLFVYNNDNINGPYEIKEIIKLWLTKKVKNDQMWIKRAVDDSHWFKLEFPETTAADMGTEINEVVKKECMARNKKIKDEFPLLYKHLIQGVLDKEMKQCAEPKDIPRDAKLASSKLKLLIKILGKLLMSIMLFVIAVHDIATVLIGAIYACVVLCCYKGNNQDTQDLLIAIFLIISDSGMMIVPIVVVSLILSQSDLYGNEIQSWMIAYIIWGALSFVISSIYAYAYATDKHTTRKNINLIVLLIIGVDFEGTKVEGEELKFNDPWKGFGILYVFPSVACLMPAAITGFIANFILEEKFTLKCAEEIKNDYLCPDDKNGCCEIVSSYDLVNSYMFIGGLASNILAIWAVIRIVGYLMVNAPKSLALYAKRKN
eukprot:302633_1